MFGMEEKEHSTPLRNVLKSKGATRGVLLKISQNSQENTCARASSLLKMRVWHRCFYYPRRVSAQNFRRIARNSAGTVRFHNFTAPKNYVKFWVFKQCCKYPVSSFDKLAWLQLA